MNLRTRRRRNMRRDMLFAVPLLVAAPMLQTECQPEPKPVAAGCEWRVYPHDVHRTQAMCDMIVGRVGVVARQDCRRPDGTVVIQRSVPVFDSDAWTYPPTAACTGAGYVILFRAYALV